MPQTFPSPNPKIAIKLYNALEIPEGHWYARTVRNARATDDIKIGLQTLLNIINNKVDWTEAAWTNDVSGQTKGKRLPVGDRFLCAVWLGFEPWGDEELSP